MSFGVGLIVSFFFSFFFFFFFFWPPSPGPPSLQHGEKEEHNFSKKKGKVREKNKRRKMKNKRKKKSKKDIIIANIICCLWCFTLLMNLHDFVTEPSTLCTSSATRTLFPFLSDHISTCLMSLCTLQASTVLVCSEHVVNGKCSICSYPWQRDCWWNFCDSWSTMSIWTRGNVSVDGSCQHSWSTMRSWWRLSALMECHEVSGGWKDQHLLVCGQRGRWLMRVRVSRTHR